ncbi:MAG: endo-1,4-beta-xylanase [Spirochaetales bacterium]
MAENGRFVGNIAGQKAGDLEPEFSRWWDQVTPGNAGKWAVAEPEEGTYRWESLDAVYELSRRLGIPFKQHTFAWGLQQPEWIHQYVPEEQTPRIERWIRDFAARYREVELIDVVNEPLTHPAPYRWALGGSGATGWDWVVRLFELARTACPGSALLINEHSVPRDAGKMDEYLRIVTVLRDRGLVDGVGLQAHYLESTPLETIRSNLARVVATGMPLYVSEFDVDIADDARHLEVFTSIFGVFWEADAVCGVTLWGYREGSMWRKHGYLVRADGSLRPAMEWLMERVR